MKTTLKQIDMKGLRSFVEPTSIALPDSGLLLFTGPSGSGKSSVFMAISHALGYCPYSATDLQSWLGDEKLEVRLTLGTSEGDSTIVRGPKSFIEGAGAVAGASNINPAVQKLTGLSTELLSALTYRPQGTRGLFLSKTNSEMQEFLSILLGLNKFDEAVEKTKANIEDLTTWVTSRTDALTRCTEQLSKVDTKTIPVLKDESLFDAQISKAKEIWQVAKMAAERMTLTVEEEAKKWKSRQREDANRIADVEASFAKPVTIQMTPEIEKLGKLKQQAKDRIDRLQKEDKVRIAEARAKLNALHDEISGYSGYIKREAEWQNERKVRLLELEKLQSAKCPRCEQKLAADAIEADLLKTQSRLEEIGKLLHSVTESKKSEFAAREEVASLQQQLDPDPMIAKMGEAFTNLTLECNQRLAELRAVNEKAKTDYQAAISAAVADIREAHNQAANIMVAETEARNKVLTALNAEATTARLTWAETENRFEAVKRENEYARKEAERLTAERTAAKDEYEQAKTKLDLTQSALREEQDLLEMLRAFLTAIYDEVLDEIAYSTNEMLSRVPNVAHVTIKFKSETTTQKGTTKRAITPFVNLGGGERALRSALSGGMMSAVELAVDLAVRKVISARSGAIPGWLVLDECFEGLGIADKEACLELLKQASQSTLILVIDHSSETKELFSQVIEIENTNGRSRIAED